MKKLLLILLMPMIGFGQCIKGDCENGLGLYFWPDGSYTNELLSNKSLSKEKVLEEINELIEAIENDSNKIHEAADVLYHLIMYFEVNEIKIEDVCK